LLLVAACLLRPPPAAAPPAQARVRRTFRFDLLVPAALIVLALALLWAAAGSAGADAARLAKHAAAVLMPGAVLLWFVGRRAQLALALGGFLIVPPLADLPNTPVVARGFFGVHRVRLLPADELVVLQNGTTLHGVQSTRPGEELTPFVYYHRDGPFGRLFEVLARRPAPSPRSGCSDSAPACWAATRVPARPGPSTRSTRSWSAWPATPGGSGSWPIAATIRPWCWATPARPWRTPPGRYDVLVVDTFSSDSVPVHLLTREALALYFARLKPGGVVVFHISNRYLDLAPVVARLAADAGAPARTCSCRRPSWRFAANVRR
jgi:hypothetical protein